MAIITVPLTALAVSGLEPKDMPQGAALNNMMRQLGGSFGIALVNTYLTNRNAVHRTDLISHLSPGDPLLSERLSGYTHYFAAKGATALEAQDKALKLLDNEVMRQSNVLSFGDAYLLIGIVFLLSLPLLLLAGRKKQTGRPAPVMLSDH